MMAQQTFFTAVDAVRLYIGATDIAGCAERGLSGMADMEKVLKGLELCIDQHKDCHNCCYYHTGVFCTDVLMRDAMELLKEQEAKIERLEHDLSVAEKLLRQRKQLGKAVRWDD